MLQPVLDRQNEEVACDLTWFRRTKARRTSFSAPHCSQGNACTMACALGVSQKGHQIVRIRRQPHLQKDGVRQTPNVLTG